CYNTALVFSARLWQPWMPLHHTVDAYNRMEMIFRAIDDSLAKTPYPPQAAASLLNVLTVFEAEVPNAKAAIESDLLNFWQVLETASLEQVLYTKGGRIPNLEYREAGLGMDLGELDAETRGGMMEARPFVEDAYMRLVIGEEIT